MLDALSADDHHWQIGPFERMDAVNPVILPTCTSTFTCPIQNKVVPWEKDHTFNPAAVVRDNKVYLFYRAEDDYGMGIGYHTSRIGIAHSDDGLHFKRNSTPVLFPDNDHQKSAEWPGGCEDPRVVETEDGKYVMMYTQWNRQIALLSVAISHDLYTWEKHGYVFDKAFQGTFGKIWCKSGSVVCRVEGDRLIATKIQGKYWMYWGEGFLHAATSDDLITWEPLLGADGKLLRLAEPRAGKFDSALVEAGAPAVMTKRGIVLLYNGKNAAVNGDSRIDPGAYAAGQLLFSSQDPVKVLARSEECFLKPEHSFERTGQYASGTVFVEGLVYFQGKWLLYYGTADSAVGVAVATPAQFIE